MVNGVLAGLLLVTLPATLTLPKNPYRVSPHEWPGLGRQFVAGSRQADAAPGQGDGGEVGVRRLGPGQMRRAVMGEAPFG